MPACHSAYTSITAVCIYNTYLWTAIMKTNADCSAVAIGLLAFCPYRRAIMMAYRLYVTPEIIFNS